MLLKRDSAEKNVECRALAGEQIADVKGGIDGVSAEDINKILYESAQQFQDGSLS